jgi:ABC-type branched-subunit amino acid transport system substrate-binding protein
MNMAQGGLGVVLRRRWRQFREGPARNQIVVGVVALAVIAGLVTLGVALGSGGSNGSTHAVSATAPGSGGATTTTPLVGGDSSRGVTADAITVVFPILDIASLPTTSVFANGTDESYAEAIKVFVAAINAKGGINGRRIIAQVEKFNPSDDADMRAKCLKWTKDEAVFAVVDASAWHDDHQLCLTQEGRTPLISSWTTVTEFANRGAPYLWWAGVDQGQMLRDLVPWAVSHNLIGPGVKFAIVASDRASDSLAVNNYLKPALAAAGLTPTSTEIINYNPQDSATASAQAPSVVERLRAAGVKAVLPLMPLPSLLTYLQAATSQQYFPTMVLSDYEQTISIGLGLAESIYQKALDGQLGLTYQTLGNSDDSRGYNQLPQAADCFKTWIDAHPTPFTDPDSKGQGEVTVESQGPIMTECQNIRLFAAAAQAAGPNLTRRTFADAMAKVTNFPAVDYPLFSFGPNDHGGAKQTRTVRIHVNDPAHNGCPLLISGKAQGSCWLVLTDFGGRPGPTYP